LLCLITAGVAFAQPPREIATMTPEQLKAGIERLHPAAYYILAEKLFDQGSRDEAVFWFYAGQLRARFHIVANPKPSSGDEALFATLNSVVGQTVNSYAFGDLKAVHATIDKVLAWDKDTPNLFTSKETNEAAWNETRQGMREMQKYLDENAESIRQQRSANGLPNRP
jgi:hypothetical protein